LGEVFVAEDTELHREVALKEMQSEPAADPQCRDRFLLEAEITGGLEHPGIVPVYGLGVYPDGRPYYAMRFIRGDNLKEAIARFHKNPNAENAENAERHRTLASSSPRFSAFSAPSAFSFSSLEFRGLLRRFIDVCNAVAYAHSRGVLHRDLKPDNVMLGKFGETLVVDWGLAKVQTADHNAPAEESMLRLTRLSAQHSGLSTLPGSALGTPAYMAPEQAAGRLDLLSPATDVYCLGATLFTLLTNRAPVEHEDLGDILRRVQLGDVGFHSIAATAEQHGEKSDTKAGSPPRSSARPVAAVPAPLKAICCKAMSLKPVDRYATPLDLARDIENWLADEPVSCLAETWSVRARRWTRKHPRTVAGLAAAVLVGIVGLAASLFFVNAEKNRTELARRQAEHSAELARRSEQEAKDREAETAAVLGFVERRIFAAARPKDQQGGLGHDVQLADAVKAALPFVEKSFTNQPLVEARLRLTMGSSFRYLGEANVALEQDQAAYALLKQHRGRDHTDTLHAMGNLALSYAALGRHDEALKLKEEMLALTKATLGPDHVDTLRSMNNLAGSYFSVGRHADAVKLCEETLELMKAKLGPDHADTLRSIMGLATCYNAVGRHAEALKLHQEALALMKAHLGPSHPETLQCMGNLASTYGALGQHDEALKLREETLRLMKSKLGLNHPDTLASMVNLANAYAAQGRHADALTLREQSLPLIRAKLGADHPTTILSMFTLGLSRKRFGNYAGAEEMLLATQSAVASGKATIHPGVRQNIIPTLIDLYDAWGKPAEAEKWIRKLPAEQRLRITLERHDAWPLLWGWSRF
jgi:serine/threonine protein kinase/tetratricopeptide (TPR) repeat protein